MKLATPRNSTSKGTKCLTKKNTYARSQKAMQRENLFWTRKTTQEWVKFPGKTQESTKSERYKRISTWMLFIFHVGKGKFLRSFISFLRSFISFFRSFISRLRGEFSFSKWRLANILVEDGGSGVSGELFVYLWVEGFCRKRQGRIKGLYTTNE